jgi:NAD(P)-dependent dehydrogenase (short-subunit alcohol dehydrogenase family)
MKPNPFDLTGKTFLITGASSGLGKQTAVTVSECGGEVYITGRNKQRLEETFNMLKGKNHSQIIADLTKEEDINALVDELPKINGVVFSVGISNILPISFVNADNLSEALKTNFESVVLLNSRIFRKKKIVRDAGSIVFISSISTQYPFIGGALYISTKAAIEGYSRALAVEMAPKGIRSNCIRPAYVKTPMTDATEDLSKDIVKKIEQKQLLGIGDPEDVANTIVFFLSDASRWITGSNLILGGG